MNTWSCIRQNKYRILLMFKNDEFLGAYIYVTQIRFNHVTKSTNVHLWVLLLEQQDYVYNTRFLKVVYTNCDIVWCLLYLVFSYCNG